MHRDSFTDISLAVSATDPSLTLDKLGKGRAGVVLSLHAGPDCTQQAGLDVTRRLRELGFVAGERVRVLQRGVPGGEPIAVRVGSSTFALRRFEAALVSILPEA